MIEELVIVTFKGEEKEVIPIKTTFANAKDQMQWEMHEGIVDTYLIYQRENYERFHKSSVEL